MEVDWKLAEVGPPDAEGLLTLCREFGFRGFANRVAEAAEAELAPVEWESNYQLIGDLDALNGWVPQLATHDRLGLLPVYEATGNAAEPPALVGLAIATAPGAAGYVPLQGERGDAALAALAEVLQAPQPRKVGSQLKPLVTALQRAGIALAGIEMDVTIASFLVDAGARNHSIADLSQRYLKHTPPSFADLLGTGETTPRCHRGGGGGRGAGGV